MFIVASMIQGVVSGVMRVQAEERYFQEQLLAMPYELRQGAIDLHEKQKADRAAIERQERQHREMVEAISDKRSGILPFLFGFIIGKS